MIRTYTRISGLILILAFYLPANAQMQPKSWTSAEIYEGIKKLNFLGSALYVAAHPDDENQRLIAYLSNEMKATTTYLAMTRGDGGQNEIGPEIEELLGIIRTQELLAARRIDGGNQMFSRTVDFGFSKNPEETLAIWGREEALSDVVWAVRKWQPDVIINRFQHEVDPRWQGRMHGHHTASAMLSMEAFDLAADKNVFPEQLKYVDTWQPRRIFFNTSWWFYGSQEKFKEADKSRMAAVDIGVYYPTLGRSNTEIAAAARSMHKAQGFGDMGSRGSQMEYLELLKGDMPNDKENLFEGINTTWSRVSGGEPVGKILAAVEKEFDFEKPAASLPSLMEALSKIEALPDGHWKRIKLAEIKEVIKACAGLYLEAVANASSAVPGGQVELNIELTNRSDVPVVLHSLQVLPSGLDTAMAFSLAYNQENKIFKKVSLPEDIPYTNPYWLNQAWQNGLYTVPDQQLRGLPMTPHSLKVQYELEIAGRRVWMESAVIHKYEDPVKGEVYRPFEIIPPVFANIAGEVYLFGDDAPKTVEVRLKAGADKVSGLISLDHGHGWRAEPAEVDFELGFKGEEKVISFTLYPPEKEDESTIKPLVKVGGKTYDRELVTIDYDHIPFQTVLRDASVSAVRIDVKKEGDKVAYIMGLGDEIPASLGQIGYEVNLLKAEEVTPENLRRFDAVILGVRAYNGLERARFIQPVLFDYVKEGGTLIVQYNKNFGMTVPMKELGPYPLEISRGRVSVEEAEVRFLKPEHPVLNFPNKITREDFKGWVQERGLYFPGEWDERYEAVISANDPGESPLDGGLLVAEYGNGFYIYTSYSWFRQLPAGVPGAFRIFANMISIGKQKKR